MNHKKSKKKKNQIHPSKKNKKNKNDRNNKNDKNLKKKDENIDITKLKAYANNLEYIEACELDHRSFCKTYWSVLMREHIAL